jgi:type IV pilus assembly protein PilO
MAISFREYPWYLQALVFFALALVIIGAGEYLPISPVATMRTAVAENHTKDSELNREVDQLQVYERRNAEFKLEMASLEKQLETLKTIVPEEKELDEFIRLLQGSAAASGVQIRTLTANAVVAKDYHYELPFSISVDGPYYNIEDFFSRLSRLSRIINVGDLKFSGIADTNSAAYPVRPGTTVTGTCLITTFFSKADDAATAAAAKTPPAKR